MKSVILNNLGLKLLALILAVVTWFYIVVELHKGTVEEREVIQGILPVYRMGAKRLPIKLNLVGEPQKGYIVLHNKIEIDPPACVIVGPRSLLNRLQSLQTQPIDISEHTKSFTKDISLDYPVKGVEIKEKFISVTVPIVKAQ